MDCITTNAYNTTASKIIEVLQWGETGLGYIYLGNCQNLRKIASPTINSFKDLDSEYGLDRAFEECISLTEIPSDLFSNCPQVTSFACTFYGCTSLTGYAPELWTRGTNTEENSYQGNPDRCNCFSECTGLSNYDIIPDYWKDSVD